MDQGLGWAGRVQGAQMIKGQDTSANHIPIYLFTVWVVGMGFPGVHTANAHFISSLLCDNYKSITLLKALQQRQLGHQLSSSAPWLGAHRK